MATNNARTHYEAMAREAAGEKVDVLARNRYQLVAVNDCRDYCECCGRKGLKRVVWIVDLETGEEKHFGTTCAMAPSKAFGLDREIKQAIREAEHAIKVRWTRAWHAYKQAGGTTEQFAPGQWRATDRALLDRLYQEATP